MGLELSTLATTRHTRTFEYAGELIVIDVLPHKITPAYRAKLATLARKAIGEESDEQKHQDAQMVSDLLAGWDVLWDGKPYPPTYKNLMRAPCTLIALVAAEIMLTVAECLKGSK